MEGHTFLDFSASMETCHTQWGCFDDLGFYRVNGITMAFYNAVDFQGDKQHPSMDLYISHRRVAHTTAILNKGMTIKEQNKP